MTERSDFAYPSIQLRLPGLITSPRQATITTTIVDKKTQETIYDYVSQELLPDILVGIK